MSLDGITLEHGAGHALCRIETFSDELKSRIRSELITVAHGAAHYASIPEAFSYKNTLAHFLESYKKKTKKTQKGMIGELLSHILMPLMFKNLTSLSVFLNKEEGSIKKGFDIIYLDMFQSELWYSEVKSGERLGADKSDAANTKLLGRARKDLKDKFTLGKQQHWYNALIDVTLTLGETKGKSAKLLLSENSPLNNKISNGNDKNVILVSVLYECPTNPFIIKSIKEYLDKVLEAKDFKGAVLFSIQKKTFEKVAEFLEAEIATHV